MEQKTTPGMSQEQLEQVLWFFRTEDPSAWNYSVLGLAVVAFVLGLFILGRNVMANRKRKNDVQYTAASVDLQSSSTAMKQAYVDLTEEAVPRKPDLGMDMGQERGEIRVEWKDGTITSLYREAAEEDV